MNPKRRRGLAAATGAVAVLALVVPGAASASQLAITFDDLPAHSVLPPGVTRVEVARRIIDALKAARLPPVYGFVNGVQLGREPASGPVLRMWRAAGFPLGNHTWSHPNLNSIPLEDWEADVVRNEPLLQEVMGHHDWRWLRFPYLSEGDTPKKRTAARAFLAHRGYRIAQVTMSFEDYAFNEPYARCEAKGDKAAVARLEQDYLAAAAEEIGRASAMSRALYARDIPYVLLMHLGAFDARMAPRLLNLYRERGFSFVTLPAAEKDAFYRPDIDLSASSATDTLEAAMSARGLSPPPKKIDLAWLDSACR